MSRFAAPATLLLLAVVSFAGCESKGPAQQAGETIT
jgi:predicted small lipoprotein YifL